MLRCIRCAACMNHCPVYGAIGGHAYGWVYPGPMGAVLTPSLIGVDKAGNLPNASTFCGKCESVCPVKIPLPMLMRHWREREFERHLEPAGERGAAWRCGAGSRAARRCIGWSTRAGAAVLGLAGAQAGAVAGACPSPAAGPPAATCPRPRATRSLPATPAARGGRARMSKDTVLTAIRRGLRRGPLPEDQEAVLRARLAAHPRHLIPARSRVPHRSR